MLALTSLNQSLKSLCGHLVPSVHWGQVFICFSVTACSSFGLGPKSKCPSWSFSWISPCFRETYFRAHQEGGLDSGLCFPGCLSLTGPGSVSGYVGGSLHVQCQYGKSYKNHLKYWCRGEYDTKCKTIVETKGNGEEKKNGRVSIRDHTENFTMTVTMENLSEDDAGSYWCKIQTFFIWDSWSRDPAVLVKVHVFPGKTILAPATELLGRVCALDIGGHCLEA